MNRHRHPSILVTALLLATGLSACNSPGTAPMTSETPKTTIEFKQNPNPQRAYRIVMEIESAPGPFAQVLGAAQYDVVNEEECGEFREMAGGYNREVNHVPLVWEKLSENKYATTVYVDLMLDEDYFGRGLCRWKFTHANASLRATGAKEETMFQPDISAEEVVSKKEALWYFWKEKYNTNTPLPSTGEGVADFGYRDLERVPVERRGEFFSVILRAEESRP